MTQIEIYYEGDLRTRSVHSENRQEIRTDAPKENMGKGELFSPTDLIAVALGSCVLTLMGIMGNKLKVDLTGLRSRVEKEMTDVPSRRLGKLIVHVYCPQTFDEEVQRKLEVAGSKCPVYQSLHPDISQEYFFHWGEK